MQHKTRRINFFYQIAKQDAAPYIQNKRSGSSVVLEKVPVTVSKFV